MVERGLSNVTAHLLDETVTLTLDELSGACCVRRERIVELVEEGVIDPDSRENRWNFRATQLRRARKAIRLQEDLGINPAGAAVVLDLLEELEALRARLGDA